MEWRGGERLAPGAGSSQVKSPSGHVGRASKSGGRSRRRSRSTQIKVAFKSITNTLALGTKLSSNVDNILTPFVLLCRVYASRFQWQGEKFIK